jgi:Uncharacterised nucleotidyltransferase
VSRLLRADHVLALRAALLPGEAALAAFAEWRRLTDFAAIDAATQRLVPLIYHNVGARAGADPVLGRMRGIYRRTWVINELRLAECARAIATLNAAGIPSALLKGAAMIVRWIRDPGLRWMGDLDVLVERGQARAAIEALVGEGWRPEAARADRFREADLEEGHAVGLRSPSGQELDLHWRALREGRLDGRDRALWERAEPIQIGGQPTRVLAPEDHVYHACAHAASWSGDGRIDWAADAAIIHGAVGARFDWERLVGLARGDRLEVPVGALVALLGEALAIPVPASVTRALRPRRPAIVDRLEFALRRRRPHELGRLASAFLALQDHRRRTGDLIRRRLPATLVPFARARWVVDGPGAALSYATFAALGRPPRLRRLLARDPRSRGLAARDLVELAEDRLDLSAGGSLRDSLVYGWSFPEAEGRWTDGSEAVLAVRIGRHPPGDLPVRVRARPCLHPRHPAVSVEVWANDRQVAFWAFRYGAAWSPGQTFVVPRAALERHDTLALTLVPRPPCRPMALGLSLDPRRLGLFVHEIQLGAPTVAEAFVRPLDLRAGSPDTTVLWEGWAAPEATGCWTDGPRAVVRLRLPARPTGDLEVALEATPFADGAHRPVRVTLEANGARVATWPLAAGPPDGGPLRAVVPRAALRDDGGLTLAIAVDGPVCPAKLGLSRDRRRLGLHVARISLEA